MWGSDYPPVSMREGYGNALKFTMERLADKSEDERALMFGGVAARLFGFEQLAGSSETARAGRSDPSPPGLPLDCAGRSAHMDDIEAMERCIELAREAFERGDHPFGSVLVRDGAIFAEGRNQVNSKFDPTAHAETEAIREACKALETLDLSGFTIYASGEPCWMCAHDHSAVRDRAGGHRRAVALADRRLQVRISRS